LAILREQGLNGRDTQFDRLAQGVVHAFAPGDALRQRGLQWRLHLSIDVLIDLDSDAVAPSGFDDAAVFTTAAIEERDRRAALQAQYFRKVTGAIGIERDRRVASEGVRVEKGAIIESGV